MDKIFIVCVLSALIQITQGQVNGPWTGNDFMDEDNVIQVINGIIYGLDTDMQRRLNSTLMLQGEPDLSHEFTKRRYKNVLRVEKLLPKPKWDTLFSRANSLYQYNDFLKAVGKFPKFCNEKPDYFTEATLDEVCLLELASIFAHITQSSGQPVNPDSYQVDETDWLRGLVYTADQSCVSVSVKDSGSLCNYYTSDWSQNAYPITNNTQYYGRGPFMMTYNSNYGEFSNSFFNTAYGDRSLLLQYPHLLETNGYASFSSALWYYMTPSSPSPSMHEVMTHYWKPNTYDYLSSIQWGFGTTINIIDSSLCGLGGSETRGAFRRAQYFIKFFRYFELSEELLENTGCANQGSFSQLGSAVVSQYIDKSQINDKQCKINSSGTPYNIWSPHDYKRCIYYNFLTASPGFSLKYQVISTVTIFATVLLW